jgi:hypothetical protein
MEILCCFCNDRSQTLLLRIPNTSRWVERSVSSGDCLTFKALPDDYLEIHSAYSVSAILTDKIRCDRLACSQT